jgi:peptide/nickel transport system substrate-binding protein
MGKPLLACALLLPLMIAGCREKVEDEPESRVVMGGVLDAAHLDLTEGTPGGVMVRADLQELDTLNIVTTRSRSVYAVLTLVFEGLLSVNPLTGEIQGGIAREYSVVNDGYGLLLKLNEDVRFSDGRPCTADDVLFSFEEIYMNPEVESKKTQVLTIRDTLVSLNRVDDYTVLFELPVPYRPFLRTLTELHILPKHILEPGIQQHGIDWFNRKWGEIGENTERILGTGPYRLEELVEGQYLRLTRNPHYAPREGSLHFDGMPYLDEIVELLDLDDETRILKFQIGEMDFYQVRDTDIASGDMRILMENRDEGSYDIYTAGHTLRGNHFLAFNQNPRAMEGEKYDIFSNAVFRRAVSHLIDRDRVRRDIYRGYSYTEESPERGSSFYHTSIRPVPHSMNEARSLLDGLSLHDRDGDGYRDLPSGGPFSISLLTNGDNPFRVQMGELIAESMQAAGLDVRFEAMDYDLIVTKLLDTFEWDAVILGVEGSIEPNEASWIWESKGALHLWNPYQESPATEWERRIDVLFALGRTEWDANRARSHYLEYQRIIAEELPVLQITVPAELYGFRRGYGNVVPSSATYNAVGLIPFLYMTSRERRSSG